MKRPTQILMFMCSMLLTLPAFTQVISRSFPGAISNTACPGTATQYEVSLPTGFSGCQISWTITNGRKTSQSGNTVIVEWNDTPGAKGKVEATFSSCGNSNDGKAATPLEELILSINNQSWGTYGSSINLDYCTRQQIYITVPRMFVQGTGGIAQPPLTEVTYKWTVPDGWREVGTNNSGTFGSPLNYLTIEPVGCAKPGNVTVYGTLVGSGPFCNSAGNSATATISLNGANPVATVGPQVGYTGGSNCNTSPVTFYATTSLALGCISSYNWHYPTSWAFVSQSGNSITLQPSGTQADSNPINATINFACGSSITSGDYVPPYAPPGITGLYNVCQGGSTYTFNNVPIGATISWTATPSFLFATASGSFTFNGSNGITLSTNNNLQNGKGTLAVTITTSCAGSVPLPLQTVWVGLPDVYGYYNGQAMGFSYYLPTPDATYSYNNLCSGVLATTDMHVTGGTGSWQRIYANPTYAYWSVLGNNNIDFSFYAVGQTAVFRYTAHNGCGTLAQDYYFKSIDCSSGGGDGCLQYAVSPNPTSTAMSIMVPNMPPPCGGTTSALSTITNQTDEELQNSLTIQSVTLIDADGRNKHAQQFANKTKKVDLDVSGMKKGVYILRVSDGKYMEDHRIVIE